ncbi:MAG: prephenate dehydratase [Candidatus Firestonebacteria bacterium GWA2_43_8]|nr:MAG: prephenate dehydratase [Candidatus Firestonebacteria bacterium GWA2_43_8]
MDLKKIRMKIDGTDKKLLSLLNKRAGLALEVKKHKPGAGHEVYVPEREAAVFQKILAGNKGPFPDNSVKAVFKEIISASRALQAPLKIAYWGPEATFTHLAALRHFGSSVELVAIKNLADIFAEVENGRADFGVIPIENSTEGVVNHTLDMFVDSELKICAETLLKISYNLLSKSKKLSDIKRIYAFHQPLAQCRNWVKTNLPEAEIVEAKNTAESARLAAKDKSSAALANSLAGELYGLNSLAVRIEDIPDNVTRFLVIGRKTVARTGNDKTSVLVSLKDKVGALYSMLLPFKKHKISLTSIESRPSRKKAWEYYFFIDLQGHIEDPNVKKALTALRKECQYFKVLGSYPAEK